MVLTSSSPIIESQEPKEVPFPLSLDQSVHRSIRLEYTPDYDLVNDQPIGATPVRIIMRKDNVGRRRFATPSTPATRIPGYGQCTI